MSQQSEAADLLYARTAGGPVAAASFVGELRTRWGPDPSAGSVNFFVAEVAGNLLRRDDVDVGDMGESGFASWNLEPWEASDRIANVLASAQQDFHETEKIVFSRKKPNQPKDSAP